MLLVNSVYAYEGEININSIDSNDVGGDCLTNNIESIDVNNDLNENGKAIANTDITFTINNNPVNVKTNDKGVATLKVTLNSVKSYKLTVSFKGNDAYESISKEATIKVTKEKTDFS